MITVPAVRTVAAAIQAPAVLISITGGIY